MFETISAYWLHHSVTSEPFDDLLNENKDMIAVSVLLADSAKLSVIPGVPAQRHIWLVCLRASFRQTNRCNKQLVSKMTDYTNTPDSCVGQQVNWFRLTNSYLTFKAHLQSIITQLMTLQDSSCYTQHEQNTFFCWHDAWPNLSGSISSFLQSIYCKKNVVKEQMVLHSILLLFLLFWHFQKEPCVLLCPLCSWGQNESFFFHSTINQVNRSKNLRIADMFEPFKKHLWRISNPKMM